MIMIIITRTKNERVEKNENEGNVELTLSDCLFLSQKDVGVLMA